MAAPPQAALHGLLALLHLVVEGWIGLGLAPHLLGHI